MGLLVLACCEIGGARAAEPDPVVAGRLPGLLERLDGYIGDGMTAFHNPGLAIGIVMGDEVVFAKGYGVRAVGGEPVDPETVFQIGSATKGFLATTLAIGVDRGRFGWDDRVVDLYSGFQLKDPWVTQEFRVSDLLAQRSGLPPYANDILAMFDLDDGAMIRSLRHVDPVSSFRSTFAYTNITHLVAGRIAADTAQLADWEAVVHAEILEPLGMDNTSLTAEAIETAPNHASGHRWTPEGTVEVPFTPMFPYAYAGAGAINSTVDDMTRWLRLQLGDGSFEGTTIVSPENLAATRLARVGIRDGVAYALGWVIQSTLNGTIVWHNGGTPSFGAFVGFSPDKGFGVVVLTNESNVGFPDAVGIWVLDRLLGNAEVDHVANALRNATASARADAAKFAPPADPAPPPPPASLVGTFANPAMGRATVAQDSGSLRMTFEAGVGPTLRLTPWNAGVFAVTLLQEGRVADFAANEGPDPIAFAQAQMDATGALDVLRITASDGQSYAFDRVDEAPTPD